MSLETFPQFSDGDVEIRFSLSDEVYILHSWWLSLHSSWFKASLSGRWNMNTTSDASSKGQKPYYVYELRFDIGTDFGTLMKKSNLSAATETEFVLGSVANVPKNTTQAAEELHNKRIVVIKAHQELFSTLYHMSPTLRRPFYYDRTTMAQAELSIKKLIEVSKMYFCEHVTRLRVRHPLRLHDNWIS